MRVTKDIKTELVWEKYQEGVKQVAIAEKFGIHRNTVRYHIQKYKKALTENQGGSTPQGNGVTANMPERLTEGGN